MGGFFSIHLARHCRHVLGLEYQQRYVDAANMIKEIYRISNVDFVQDYVETMPAGRCEPADFGAFAGNPENIDGSAYDIVLYPSPNGLL